MPRIVISARPESDSTQVRHIADRIKKTFGASTTTVLNDVPEQQMRLAAIQQAQVFLIIIDSTWQPGMIAQSANPYDFPRYEVEFALARGQDAVVIPVLIGDTPMPTLANLPSSIQGITYLQALPVQKGITFKDDLSRIAKVLRVKFQYDRSKENFTWFKIVSFLPYLLYFIYILLGIPKKTAFDTIFFDCIILTYFGVWLTSIVISFITRRPFWGAIGCLVPILFVILVIFATSTHIIFVTGVALVAIVILLVVGAFWPPIFSLGLPPYRSNNRRLQ